ncbi:MAG: response regulator, partial [Candidatus Limnocylindria bacterium]
MDQGDRVSGTKIEVVDDHFLFAQALAAVIRESDLVDLVGIATTGPQALAMARDHQPDVVLLDHHLPGYPADLLIPRLLSIAPEARIIVLTDDTSDAALASAVRAGAVGFLTKDRAIEDVVASVTAATTSEALLTAEEDRAQATALYELSRLI